MNFGMQELLVISMANTPDLISGNLLGPLSKSLAINFLALGF
jgi:hypothetical protein